MQAGITENIDQNCDRTQVVVGGVNRPWFEDPFTNVSDFTENAACTSSVLRSHDDVDYLQNLDVCSRWSTSPALVSAQLSQVNSSEMIPFSLVLPDFMAQPPTYVGSGCQE